ncbi:hypothetical protein PVAND_017833 [Polypedilum vanderplanki]|uniref:URB1 N-terminal domain-containing protein n=1 Tax=Polypedilum vanderplanki TaxID=319348 RepID=A0A9J6B8Y4_POLVA|nr:hypothetical protein PVAND_017833 [Polypedilum vanderplanki]
MKRKRESVLEDQEVEKKSKVDENLEPNREEIFNFDIKLFRKKLKKESNNFFDDLKFFVNNAEKSPQLISDFLELGGRPLEIVEAISRNEQNNDVLSNLFQMLQYVSSKIIQQKGDSILQGLKFLVTKHSNTITKMLSSTKPSDKKVALKILDICVSTNRELGVDILKNIEVFTKTKNKEDLSEIFKVTKQQEQIRAAFVEFIISFLYNDADAVLRKRLLQNRILFELLLQDLHKDNSQIIERVLSVITEKILMSSDFSRLEKFKTFSSEVVKSLLKLYDWRGNESEKEHIQTISHYFLKLLLTNKKYGIVFKPFAEKVKNLRQLDVITTFKNVWMLEYPSNLVIEIVKACPDLIQPILDRLVMALRPKETTSWLMCVNFTKNLITAFDPKVMINFFTLLPAKKVSNNIIKLSVSELILENTKDNALIQLDKLEIREAVVSLLHLMLDRCCKFLDEIKILKNLKDFEQHRIKFDIINHIFTFFPNIDMILNSLYRSINLSVRKKSDENEALVKSQLKHTLEILLLLIERFPSIIEKIPSVVDYLEVLRPIYEYQLNSTNIEDNSGLEIEMKVVKIILLLQPNILSSDATMFNKIFSIMIQVYSCSKNENYRKEAKLLTSKMLHSTQIFSSNNPLEISIWIEALRFMKPNVLKETANKFIELIKSIKKSDDMHEKLEIKTLNQNLLKMIDNFEESEEVVNSQLSSVLTTLLRMESGKLNNIIDFVEISFILFYHTYPDLKKSFKSLLATKSSEHCERFLAYVNADELSNFQDILPTTPEFIYRKFQQSLITGEKFNMKDINEDEHQFLLLQSIFCSIKLSENNNLTDDKIELLINNIRKFYKNLKSQEEEKPISSEQVETSDKKVVNKIFLMTNEYSTLEIIMSHIFNSQSRLFKKFNVNDEPSQITKFVVKLVEIFNTNDNLQKSLLKYRQKVITQLKESNEANDTVVMNILEEFPFSDLEYIELMNTVLKNQKNLMQLRKIMILLKKISQRKTTALSSTQIHEIENSYMNAVKNPSFDFSAEFCDIFYDYLSTFIHNIADTTIALFELALLDELTVNRSFIKLLIMIFMHNDVNNDFFIANVLNLKKEILYPILHIAFRKELIVNKTMTSLYQTFKSGILRTIEKPNRTAQIYRENIKSTIQLIEKGMPINECRDLSMKKFKFDSTEVYQLEMLSAIFMKAFEKENDKSTVVFFNFFNNWLQMFGLAEKRMYDDFEKIYQNGLI